MASINDFPARGKVIEKPGGGTIVFHPTATAYRLHLIASEGFDPPLDVPLDVIVRVRARKLWTVSSGGLFVAPIFGPPRIVQGRVRYLDEREMVLNAGLNLVVELPGVDWAYDLSNGAIEVGKLVNCSVWAGARVEGVAVAQA